MKDTIKFVIIAILVFLILSRIGEIRAGATSFDSSARYSDSSWGDYSPRLQMSSPNNGSCPAGKVLAVINSGTLDGQYVCIVPLPTHPAATP